jgi:exosortase
LWNPNGAYAYGWIVPFLAAYLYKSRWEDRPPPSTPIAFAAFSAIVFALLTLPARWLQEAAPERSICVWSYAIACVGISLSLIALAGGMSWLRWFSFPMAFVLTTVPWPHVLEMLVSNSLMHGTAGATVQILCLIGIPAVQAGNLVHIETGVIDIDEACSGIRSLQAMVMISLFLGELFRLKPPRRIGLIALAIIVTLMANVLRTVVLSSIGFSQGMAAVDHYHDAAGFIVLTFSLAFTLFAAFMLRSAKIAAQQAHQTPAPRTSPALPLKLSVALLIWFFAGEISVEAWYRCHEPKWHGWSWAVAWPLNGKDFHFTDIPRNSLRLLLCDESRSATWHEPDGSDWSLYWIRWNPGNPAAEAAKVHRPDVCLNAEGAIMEKDMGMHLATIGGIRIPFHSYAFALGEKTLYVFYTLCEEDPGRVAFSPTPRFEAVDMFQRAFHGRRNIGEQSLELALSGYPTAQSAQEAFQARVDRLIQPSQNASPATGELTGR